MKKEYRDLIEKIFKEVKKFYGKNLVSFVIFGSVAKETTSPYSDIDLLIISKNLPDGRTKRVIEFIENIEKKVEKDIKKLRKEEIFTELSPLIKKPEEVKTGSFLFLDMIEDAIIYYDKNEFFRNYLNTLKEKLKRYGAKKVYKKGGYYWVIKEDFNIKEGIEI
jgi:predicted nucleotidyltransferase